MDEIPEGWDKELYEKLSFDFLIECAENKKIDEWNALYQEYLESEWKRLYPKRGWDPKNLVELLEREPLESLAISIIKLEEMHHYIPTEIGSWFQRPNFREIDFREALSRRVCFSEVHLEGAKFTMARLEGADFSGAHLGGADFSGAHLENADFNDTHLEGADFSGAHLEGAKFWRAHIEEADLRGAHFKGANFWRAHLEKADFSGAHLEEAKFSEAQLEGANVSAAHLEEADFSEACLKGANFQEAHLEKADFSGAHLEGTDLSWAIVNENTSFRNIEIDDATGSLLLRILDCKNENGDSILCKLRKIWGDKNGTDFSNVALGTCRIDTLTKTRIEKNIRVYRWNDWYKNHKFLQIIMRPFWFLTDYGASTIRPVCAFILWNTIFAIIYFLWLGSDFQELMTVNLGLDWENIGDNIIIFLTDWMKSNLMIISLTDMATTKIESLTLFFVFLHVFVGYFILAALVARLSIMFQNLSPNDE